MVNNIKILLGLTNNDKDALISLLIDLCKSEAEQITKKEYSSKMDSAIIQMVIYKYNRLGSEGLASESYNSASFSYLTDYPKCIYDLLGRGVKFI